MRRLFPVAILSTALACAPGLLAQHGPAGGHSGFGAHSGFSGGGHFAGAAPRSFGGFSGRPGYSGVRPGGGYAQFAGNGYTGAPRMVFPAPSHALNPGYRIPYTASARSWDGYRNRGPRDRGDGRHDRDRYRSPYRGGGLYGAYPGYVNSWEVLPWDLGYPDLSGYSMDEGNAEEQAQSAGAPASPQAYDQGPEPGASSDAGYRPPYSDGSARGLSAPPPPVESAPVAPEPELTLIFRDGHQQPIHNYVLTQSTLIVLDQAASGRQQRIPLSELNLSATQKAAREAGLDFTPPA